MGANCVSEDSSGCAAQTRQNWDNVMRKLAHKEAKTEIPLIADGTNDSTIAKTLRSKTFFVAKVASRVEFIFFLTSQSVLTACLLACAVQH